MDPSRATPTSRAGLAARGFGTLRLHPYERAVRASDRLGPRGPLSRALPGYEHRPSQGAMADAVEDTLEHGGVLLVEAGTGTGKTLAYLVPALLSGKKVVISTGTRTLQDQIMERDLPFLEAHLGHAVDAAAMKGLGNYLCIRRYEELRRSASGGAGTFGRQLPVLEGWRAATESGDRADLTALEEGASIWGFVQSGSDTRIGPRCSHHEECFVTKMRRRAEAAQIVVVNHHLFFADLAMRGPHGGQVLPDYDAVIFDEAHQIEDVATLFFGTQVSTGQIERLARDADRALTAQGSALHQSDLPQALQAASESFFAALPQPQAAQADSRMTLPPGTFTDALEQRFFALDDALEALGAHCRLARAESESLGQMARRCGQTRDALAKIADGADGRAVPWLGRRGRGVSIGVSPVSVGDLLRRELHRKVDSLVFTSATMTTGGDFSFIKQRLGIDFEIDEVSLPSPFDYAEQAALYLPDLPDPRHPRFVESASKEVLDLVDITGGGAFVLCTSFRSMHALAQACRPTLTDRGHRIMVQGEAPKAALLERFRAAHDAVLFATASFWEGVDVPGDALRLVIIDKLPFQVPDDPLVRARCAALEEEGGKPFMELLVPAAALTLKQGFGRLIRSRRDRGIVALLDSRVTQKGYGRVFLKSLPDASRCFTMDETRAFWSTCSGDRADVL